jgi:hypothetical protein
MSSQCRSAVDIIGNCTRPAMNGRGGTAGGSIPSKLRATFGKKHMPRRSKRRHCEVAISTLANLQTKLDGVRREERNLTVMGLDPMQPPKQKEFIKALERSARAEMRLRVMAWRTPRISYNVGPHTSPRCRISGRIEAMSIRRATPEEFERLTGSRGSVYFGTTPRQ